MCVIYEVMTWEELRPHHERNVPDSFVTTVWILSVNCLQINEQNKGKGDQANGSMPPLKIIWTETRLHGFVVKENWGEPSAPSLWNPGYPAYDLYAKTKIF